MFLSQFDPRPLADRAPDGITPAELFLGRGDSPLQTAVFTATRPPSRPELRALHDDRKRGGVAPVAIVVRFGNGRAGLATDTGLGLTALEDLEAAQVERICAAALAAPDRHAAYRLLAASIAQLDSPVPGLRNAGLFAMHELESGVPARADWTQACAKARPLLSLTGRPLVEKLGFKVDSMPGRAFVLLSANRRLALAVFLERPDQIEPADPLFDQLSPISYALAKADENNLEYVIVSAGSTLRVYPVKPGVGTGRRGRTETYVELDLSLLRESQAGYLHLLASAAALAPDGTFTAILGASKEFAVKLGGRLRDRVYEDVVPGLAKAIVTARRLKAPTPEKLAETYEMALLALFRLLFVAYAEDKELLPLHSSASYRAHSLKEIALRLMREREEQAEYGTGDHYWSEVRQLWKAIDQGNAAWHVPAYNGGLFAPDGTPAAAALERISLPDAAFAPALRALLLDESSERVVGPIDFRSLGVREFGTIYEGLLEQELAVAERDLGVDRRSGAYLPAKRGTPVVVAEGDVYLHNASGARKASGAYYTKDFAVEHLLEHALDPALDDHLARLAARYDDREKADHFFDFHVADIAMGSGHFLVAAIDHIERKLSGFLAKYPLAAVRNELERLRTSAREALGDEYRGDAIEDTQLLRRQIARRCIHGVDLNPLSVELARLSIWIHTFVPGLPLSFLDQNLVVGNSLVGIATFDEARELLGSTDDLFALSADELLAGARVPLEKLAKLADATVAEVKEAQQLYAAARQAIRPTEDLLTILAASRIDRPAPGDTAQQREARLAGVVGSKQITALRAQQQDAFTQRLTRRAEKVLAGLKPLHFPVVFPRVFLGERQGFDVILGNPPWEKAHVEEHEFWARHYPGLRGLTQSERETEYPRLHRSRPDLVEALERERTHTDTLRELLLSGPFPGMGSGHPDLYKAFCWRFWQLVNREGGAIGVVLPRAVFASKGTEEFRKAVFASEGSLDVTTLVNNRGWVFDNVHPQYSVALAVLRRGASARSGQVALRGPFSDLASFRTRRVAEPASFPFAAVSSWTSSAALPLLPSESSGDVYLKLKRSPGFGDQVARPWRARPLQGDINATGGRSWMTFDSTPTKNRWPVFGGEAIDIWTPDSGAYYAVAESKPLLADLVSRRNDAAQRRNSVFSHCASDWIGNPKTISARHARLAFRDVTRATDSRTSRLALIPPDVFLVHTAPYILFPSGGPLAEAFLLGVMSSIPFDWSARRIAETHLTFDVLDGLPVPLESISPAVADRVIAVSARLATPDDRFAEWASHFGLEPKALESDEKDDLIAELDAAVSLLYGLSDRDVRHIFETFHVGWDHEERLRAVLKHSKALRQKT